jgi:hypothetical protein
MPRHYATLEDCREAAEGLMTPHGSAPGFDTAICRNQQTGNEIKISPTKQ